MSAYGSLKVRELRRLCVERGLQHHRMNKAALIEALQRVRVDDANDGDVSASEAASEAGSSDAEIEMGGGANIADGGDGGSVDGAEIASSAGDDESEAVKVLWLKIALAAEERAARAEEWEREQFRANMQPVNASQQAYRPDALHDVKSLLPSMCDSDALSFFLSFERVM